MPSYAKRFHLIAVASSFGFALNSTASALGRGDSTSAAVGAVLSLLLLGASVFVVCRLVK